MPVLCRFIVVCLVVGFVCARDSNASIGDGIRICGRRLIATLQKLCLHRYSGPTKEYGNYLRRAKRMAVGLATDCCSNKCSLDYIQKNICA